jgi:hypothetical protein
VTTQVPKHFSVYLCCALISYKLGPLKVLIFGCDFMRFGLHPAVLQFAGPGKEKKAKCKWDYIE